MSGRTITLTLPEDIYDQLEIQAQAADHSVDEVVIQFLARTLPPPVEEDLPSSVSSSKGRGAPLRSSRGAGARPAPTLTYGEDTFIASSGA